MKPNECLGSDEAMAEPFWFSPRITVRNWSFYETWHHTLELNRVRDIVSDIREARDRCQAIWDYIEDFLYDKLEIDESGMEPMAMASGGQLIKVETLVDQYIELTNEVPGYIMESALGGRSSRSSRYSRVAAEIMKGMGWDGESGIGKRRDGIRSPIKAGPPNQGRAGLGSRPRGRQRRVGKPKRAEMVAFLCNGVTEYGWDKGPSYGGEGAHEVDLINLSPRGLPLRTGESKTVPIGELMRVLMWGGGVKGPAESTFPHPEGWTFAELLTPIPLDQLQVRHLTAAFRSFIEAPPNCIGYWEGKLGALPWRALARKYSNGLLTPKDYMSHFKNILHHRILLRSVKPFEGSSRCRCCRRGTENTNHLASCPVLNKIWAKFSNLVNSTHKQTKLTPALIFLAVDETGHPLPQGLSALHLVVWKMVIFNLTLVQTENKRFVPDRVWEDALRRFETRISALAFKVTRKAISSGARAMKLMEPEAESRLVAPLACFGMWGKVIRADSYETEVKAFLPTPSTAGTT